MSLTICPITGGGQLADGTLPPGTKLIFRPTLVDSEGALVLLDESVEVTLDAGGLLPQGWGLFRNSGGSTGSAYAVDAVVPVAGPSGAMVPRRRYLARVYVGAAASYTLGELFRAAVPDTPAYYRILTEAEANAALVAAGVQADRAEGEADRAATKATDAASSATVATAQAGIATVAAAAVAPFADIAAGLASGSVAIGQGFYAPISTDALGLYRKDAGPVATLIASLPTSTRLNAVAAVSEGDFQNLGLAAHNFVVKDAQGRDITVASIDANGVLVSRGVQTGAASVASLTVGGAAVATVESYEIIGASGGTYIVDADNRIMGYVPPSQSTAPESTQYPPDDIRSFDPTIDLTGSADMSARIKIAHDAAFAAGLRHLYIEGPILAPSALFLGNVLFLTRGGKGRLIGTYRKRVVPMASRTAPTWSRIVPERHLKRLRAKLATATAADPAIIAYMSDSWGQPNQLVGPQSEFEEYLRREMVRQFGVDAAKIRIVNRAVGGTTWTDARGTLVQGVQSWVTGVNLPWTSYVTAIEQADLTPTTRTPDVVLFMFGMNHGAALTAAEVQDMRDVVATIAAVSPTPDIVFVTSTVPSAMSPTRGTKASQEGRQALAGYTRGYAAQRGHGLIDIARTFDCAHWGFDPWALSWTRIAAAETVTIPYTLPQACNDYGLDLVITGVATTFWALGDGLLTFPLSPATGNALILERDSGTGNIAYTINTANGKASVARTVSTLTAGGSDRPLTVAMLGEDLIVKWGGATVFNGPVDRHWAEFTPTVAFGSGGTASVTLTAAYVGEAATVMPSLTDLDLWGGDATAIGGNDENHLSEPGRAAIMAATLAATRFA